MRLVEGLLGSTWFWALQNTEKTMGKRNFVQRGKKWCGWFPVVGLIIMAVLSLQNFRSVLVISHKHTYVIATLWV